MPVPRRLAKQRLSDSEVDDQTWGLLTDQIDPADLPDSWGGRLMVVFADVLPEPNLRTAWRAHVDEIVATWAAEHPGSRPSCWWRWDAPEPRKIVAWPETAPDADAELVTMFIESEAAFLERHGLLLDGEAALLSGRLCPRGGHADAAGLAVRRAVWGTTAVGGLAPSGGF
jgi:hypothetical protein